jgi:fructose-1,6-bisphosphatase/inositol monophosphatase family enzyme
VNHADVAAALLILREAGGVITDWKGEYLNPFRITDPMNLAASNGRVHGEMLHALAKIKTAPAAASV